MNPTEHPYSRYGAALTLLKQGKKSLEEVSAKDLAEMIGHGLNHYRLQPLKIDTSEVLYGYLPSSELEKQSWLIQSTGLANKGYFLSPNAITNEKSAKQLYQAQKALLKTLEGIDEKDLQKNMDITMSITPVTGKTNQGNTSQSNPKAPLVVGAYCAIANLTSIKPVITVNLLPTAIIPDLEMDDLKKFIRLFELMLHNNTTDLLKAKRKEDVEKIPRPKIFNGNFPYAARSHAFGAAGVLGAIGQWAKEAGYLDEALPVLDSLSNTPLYIINYDKTEVVSFNHYVVELAKEYKLSNIINALEFSTLLSDEKRYIKGRPNSKYELFWMMSSRFLQLFNKPAFQNFLSHRAEYQPEVQHLLNQYFMKKENIKPEIVASAKELGRWLNLAAFIAATKQFEERKKKKPQSPQDKLDVRKFKAKFLLEIESSAFSAKTPEALLHQVIRRAGQLTFMDAPAEAQHFMDSVCEGEISMDQAKNLLLAYSRLKNVKEGQPLDNEADELLEESGVTESIN